MNSAADPGAIWPLGKIEGLSEFGCRSRCYLAVG